MKENRYILILAGGIGSRFWPASREDRPKQFLDILGVGKSLLRLTFERCLKLVPADRIYVMTNARYAGKVMEHLPELSEDQVFNEPSMQNTAPAIALASLKLSKKDPEAVCLVAPSDHVIMDEQAFTARVSEAFSFATEEDVLLTLGIQPTRPDTGYGYIQYGEEEQSGIYRVQRFTEKPDKETAEQFLRSGEYLWNSGMFVWSVKAVLAAFRRHAARTIDILEEGVPVYFTDSEEAFLRERYPLTDKTSVDYAIMEKADNVFVIPSSFGWSDLGTWGSLHDKLKQDDDGNVTVHKPVILHDSNGTLVHTTNGKLVVAAGVRDLIIVCEDDAVLVISKEKEQELKRIREKLNSDLNEYL